MKTNGNVEMLKVKNSYFKLFLIINKTKKKQSNSNRFNF